MYSLADVLTSWGLQIIWIPIKSNETVNCHLPFAGKIICVYRPSKYISLTLFLAISIQGRNLVFKVEGPIPWSRVLLPFYRKKLDRSTQFGAVGYIITLYSSKSYVKSWGSVQILGDPDPPPELLVVAPMPVKPWKLNRKIYEQMWNECKESF